MMQPIPNSHTTVINNQYSIQGYISFFKRNIADIAISMLFLLLAFGQKLFSNTFSIDTQAIISQNDTLYTSWFELERFGLVVFKKLYGLYQYNNVVASFTMVIFFGISATLWSYLFYEANKQSSIRPAFFMILYVTSPIYAEMLGFLLLGPEISIASSLVALSLMIWSNGFSGEKAIPLALASIACATISFTMYLAMVTLFITGTAMLLILIFGNKSLNENKTRKPLTFFVGSIAIFIASYIIYRILNAVAMHIKGVTTNPYITDQSRWGKDSLITIAHNIASHSISLYLGKGLFYTSVFTISATLLFVVSICGLIQKKLTWIAPTMVLLISASPLIMSFVLGNTPSVRTEMTYPLALSFIIALLLSEIKTYPTACNIRPTQVRAICWILVICIGWSQALISNRIFYTENVVFNQDVLTVQEIKTQIDSLGLGEHPNEPVVFVGNHTAQCNPDCFATSDLGLTGRSMLEIGFSTSHGTGVKQQFIKSVLGLSYNFPTTDQIAESEKAASTMPHWPDPGSVAKVNDVVVVNF